MPIFATPGETRLRDCAHSRNDLLSGNAGSQRSQTFGHSADLRAVAAPAILTALIQEFTKMQISRNYTMTWSAAFWLPVLMGGIEFLLRHALGQLDEGAFFPISLVASGISVCVTVTTLPLGQYDAITRLRLDHQLKQAIFIANMGFLASLCGVVLWIYLLLASINVAVMALLPFHPFWESSVYYLFSVMLSIEKAKVLK